MDSENITELTELNEESLNEKNDTEVAEEKQVQINGNIGKSSITLKKQPEILCNCPLHCDKKFNQELRKSIYQQFQDIGDHALQNQFIQRHIKIKSIAKRLWEEEVIDKKIQRRVTCKYLIPMDSTVLDSYYYAKTLSYDSVKFYLYDPNASETQKLDVTNNLLNKSKNCSSDEVGEIQTDSSTPPTLPTSTMESDGKDLSNELRKIEMCDINSPVSFNDCDSVSTSLDDMNTSEGEGKWINSVKYAEVCQKAFMNMFGITEKRIRWQREKLILRSRLQAERKRKELEEIDRTLSLARSLGAGCQPLFALMEKSNCLHLSDQLMGAIEDDVALVNNFFHNQLWKPEDIMNKSIQVASLDADSVEAECD